MEDINNLAEKIISSFPQVKTLTKTELQNFSVCLVQKILSDKVNRRPVKQLISEYIEKLKEENRESTKMTIDSFLGYLAGIYHQEEDFDDVSQFNDCLNVTPETVENYISYLYFTYNFTQNSVRFEISKLNNFYKYLEEQKQLGINKNPFSNIKISKIDYSSSKKEEIPSEQEIKTLIKNLPTQLAVIVAISAVKGYSLTDFYQLNFGYAEYFLPDHSLYGAGFCYTMDDMWDNIPEEIDDRITLHDLDFPYSTFEGTSYGYYENLNYPKWYNETLINFWVEEICQKSEAPSRELYYTNNGINLHSLENAITKKVKELYKAGLLSKPYTLKSLRWYAISNIYSKTHSIEKLQKLLHHTSPNTTKRFLQNAGITIK